MVIFFLYLVANNGADGLMVKLCMQGAFGLTDYRLSAELHTLGLFQINKASRVVFTSLFYLSSSVSYGLVAAVKLFICERVPKTLKNSPGISEDVDEFTTIPSIFPSASRAIKSVMYFTENLLRN